MTAEQSARALLGSDPLKSGTHYAFSNNPLNQSQCAFPLRGSNWQVATMLGMHGVCAALRHSRHGSKKIAFL